MSERAYKEPSKVDADEGEVMVDGPDGVAVSFTPEAAEETSDRLLHAACKARGQQISKERQAKGAGR